MGAAMLSTGSPSREPANSKPLQLNALVRDECWLEAESRGEPGDPKDEVVQARVAEIILSGMVRLRQAYREA